MWIRAFKGKGAQWPLLRWNLPISGAVLSTLLQPMRRNTAHFSLSQNHLDFYKVMETTNLLVAAPNAFAKDVLETRLRALVSEVLTRELGEKTNIAVTIDETLEATDLPAPDVDIEIVPARDRYRPRRCCDTRFK